MNRRFWGVLVLCAIMVMCLFGCSNTSQEDKTYDEAFLSDFVKGLCSRWDYSDKNENNANLAEDEYTEACIDKELSILEEYTGRKFDDSSLQERAINYINLLKQQKEALSYYSADYEKYIELWENAYNERAQAISAFINDYELTFPDKYKKIVDEFLTTAKVVEQDKAFDEACQKMVDSIEFELVESSYSWKTYGAVFENMTDKTISSYSLDINLLDADGVIIETTYAYADNIAPGQKARLEFSTDEDFASYELTYHAYCD